MSAAPNGSDDRPEVTVVIVARNAATTIRDCLDALRRQTGSLRFEVILVDSSSDATVEIVDHGSLPRSERKSKRVFDNRDE